MHSVSVRVCEHMCVHVCVPLYHIPSVAARGQLSEADSFLLPLHDALGIEFQEPGCYRKHFYPQSHLAGP